MLLNFIIFYFTVGGLFAIGISMFLWFYRVPNLTNSEMLATFLLWPVALVSFFNSTNGFDD